MKRYKEDQKSNGLEKFKLNWTNYDELRSVSIACSLPSADAHTRTIWMKKKVCCENNSNRGKLSLKKAMNNKTGRPNDWTNDLCANF